MLQRSVTSLDSLKSLWKAFTGTFEYPRLTYRTPKLKSVNFNLLKSCTK